MSSILFFSFSRLFRTLSDSATSTTGAGGIFFDKSTHCGHALRPPAGDLRVGCAPFEPPKPERRFTP